VDDLDMRVSHVLRAEEHLPNTPKALLLWAAISDRPPPLFGHLPLLVNEKRQKLSKRRDKVALESFRDDGFLMEALRNYLCLLGWSPGDDREIMTLDEMVAAFDLDGVNNSPAFFDVKKLTSFNERYIRALTVDEFVARTRPYVDQADWASGGFDEARFRAIAPAVQERVRTLADVPQMVDFLFLPEPEIDSGSWDKAIARNPAAGGVLRQAHAAYETVQWRHDVLHDVTAQVGESAGLALAKAQAPIRVAVTGRTVGPPLFESLELLGREETLRRIDAAVARLR
jgi:glutamyl-tRNA synthetase